MARLKATARVAPIASLFMPLIFIHSQERRGEDSREGGQIFGSESAFVFVFRREKPCRALWKSKDSAACCFVNVCGIVFNWAGPFLFSCAEKETIISSLV